MHPPARRSRRSPRTYNSCGVVACAAGAACDVPFAGRMTRLVDRARSRDGFALRAGSRNSRVRVSGSRGSACVRWLSAAFVDLPRLPPDTRKARTVLARIPARRLFSWRVRPAQSGADFAQRRAGHARLPHAGPGMLAETARRGDLSAQRLGACHGEMWGRWLARRWTPASFRRAATGVLCVRRSETAVGRSQSGGKSGGCDGRGLGLSLGLVRAWLFTHGPFL